MTSRSALRFDPHALRELGGDAVFARGERYFRDGLVDILSIEPGRVLARVAGTEDYRAVVSGEGADIAGECSCPAFAREGFCKHMVAVALAVNAGVTPGTGEHGDTLGMIRDYLRSRDVEALIEMIMKMAEWDSALFRKLEAAATVTGADDKTLEARLRALLRDATRTRGFVDYQEAGGWASGVDAALDVLAGVASGPRAALVAELAIDAIERIEGAIENIDDSDGHCTDLLERARSIHLKACGASRPDPVDLARDLFSREMQGGYDSFADAAVCYAEVLGEVGLAQYRRLAQAAWDKLPARIGPAPGRIRPDHEFSDYRLTAILDFFAERDGDVERRIALRAKNLSAPWHYLNLAEFCRAQGRPVEALRRAEEGLWMFEDGRPDERLVKLAVDLLIEADRKSDAEAHLWRAFEKAPSFDLYMHLSTLGGAEAVQRVLGVLRDKLEDVAASRWYFPADLIIRVMIEERLFDGAWAIVREHKVSAGAREALARASEATHPDKAVAVYAEHIEALAAAGSNRSYEEAVALVARMEMLQSGAEQQAYIAGLKQRHGRKRNLMKLLG